MFVRTQVLVKVEAEDAQLPSIGPGERTALKMPWFVSSLATLPQLSVEHIFDGGFCFGA